jgi:hypothetical protein
MCLIYICRVCALWYCAPVFWDPTGIANWPAPTPDPPAFPPPPVPPVPLGPPVPSHPPVFFYVPCMFPAVRTCPAIDLAVFAVRWSPFLLCALCCLGPCGVSSYLVLWVMLSFIDLRAEGLGGILRFRKFKGRSADLLRSESCPSAPPGTFPRAAVPCGAAQPALGS